MSVVWNCYEKVAGVSMAKCLLCNREYSYKTSVTNLKKHLQSKHNISYQDLVNTESKSSKNLEHRIHLQSEEGDPSQQEEVATEAIGIEYINDPDWEINSEAPVDSENDTESHNNRHSDDEDDVGSPEPAADNVKTTKVQIVPLAELKVRHKQSCSKIQRDPLQAPSRQLKTEAQAGRRHSLTTRRRKPHAIFPQMSSDFLALEQRRIRMEEERDRRFHEREMKRLQLELQRIEVQRNLNELLQHLVNVAQNAYELLQQKL